MKPRDLFSNTPLMLGLVLLLGFGTAFGAMINAYGIRLRKLPIYPEGPDGGYTLVALPAESRSWIQVGADRIESPEVVETLGTENYVSRLYTLKEQEKDPRVADFHASYYTGGIDTVPHVPERCMVAAGFNLVRDHGVVDVPLDGSRWSVDTGVPAELAGEFDAIYRTSTSRGYNLRLPPGRSVRLPRGVTPDRSIQLKLSEFETPTGRRLFAGYFFIANGGIVARAEGLRTLAFDLQSDYAYYLKVQIASSTAGSAEEWIEDAGSLIGELLPEIMMCVPDWIEVELGNYPEDNPRRGGEG